ncbi:hypothetical protein SAMN05421743_11429 [Thalassobacillus cyri]|uniref:Hydrolase n=1 Tax=Thalassobacillus cyri TaxID=571932 RepID=A0A1H4G805_9BACI|nr:hydrolase [Thalassobacillus cyri]SEB04812.1 hypothetical protein SAMN05421743_11429 [Thalassobacillus cyri]
MEKNKYYVNVGSQEISVNHDGNNDIFAIFATEEEVIELRAFFDEVHNADERAFWRAHIPFRHYHDDEPNREFDNGLRTVFSRIYELGDEKTKEHIGSMGILEDRDSTEGRRHL